ncbi:ABC transporter permease [Uliginosibacterium gangwonense]|uniref:ABC transporter permease n=1 Tax=Uliginosibacterium gangwonense TaxID=392736 RepID=UPI000372501E|nr:FtsX-like permease family protein [Uliginosibacterium gangwonense]
MNDLRLALRMLRRDLRAGELSLLIVALLLAVVALSSVGFLTDRVAQGLRRDATQMLGGDLLVSADHPVAEALAPKARELALRVTNTVTFNSMVTTADAAQLAAVKAVEAAYPLRGSLQIAPNLTDTPQEAGRIPAVGEAWLDEQLMAALQLRPGDKLQLGYLNLRVGAFIRYESDRGMGFASFAPRIMINTADLAASGLMQEGSRARYRMQLAGRPESVARFEAWVRPRLGRGETLESLDNARPEIRNGMDRAARFLRLTAMLAVVLAAVAIGLSSRRYLHRHFNSCAVMRCFGAQRGQLLRLYLTEFFVLGLVVALVGCTLGYAIQFGLLYLARDLINMELPAPGMLPVVHGMIIGVVLMLGFVAPQLLKLSAVPPISVLRREWGGAQAISLGAWGFGAALLAALMFWLAGEWLLGAMVIGGFAVAILLFAGLGWLALSALGHIRGLGQQWGLRYGLASLHRRRAASVVQVVALGLGLTALILLGLVSRDLMASWRGKIGPEAPNRFVINIQPPQKDAVLMWLREHQLPQARLEPMIRGRMLSINGRPVAAKDYPDEQAKSLVEREFSLSWSDRLPVDNRIVAGAWHGASHEPVFSMEQGIGRTLGIKQGDKVEFQVGGQRVSARVGSIRKLSWDSMRVNFFFIAAPGLLDDMPSSYITSFYLPPAKSGYVRDLVTAFPNLTIVDVTTVLAQVQSVSERLTLLVQFVSAFALIAGIIVLVSAQLSTHDERVYEVSVLRALGARMGQLRAALLAELAVLAAIAILLAAAASQIYGYCLARFVFEMEYHADMVSLALVAGLAFLGILGFGWPALRHAIMGTVAEGLRESESGAQ